MRIGKVLAVAFVFVLSTSAHSGLFKSGLERKAQKFFVKKLGIEELEIKTDKHDQCEKEQAKRWLKEFRKLDDQQQDELRSKASSYQHITLQASAQASTITGERHFLNYIRCSYVFRHTQCVRYRKAIGEKVLVTGNIPQTVLKKDDTLKTLDLLTEFTQDDTLLHEWQVGSRSLYDAIENRYSPEFESAFSCDRVHSHGAKVANTKSCGTVSLTTFMQML